MTQLSFIDELNKSQIEYAEKIATKAKEMGIPPKLAVAIAYHESRLNPNAPRGSSGEFGIMQVMPQTGKGLGYTNEDLIDPDKNIEAGLKYLKKNLDAFGGDQKLATVGYNAGTDSEFFSGGKLPKTTEDYVKAMNEYGAFSQEEPKTSGETETDEGREQRIQADMDAQERRQSEIYGAAVGAGMSATRAAGSGAGAALQSAAQRVGQGFRTGMQGGLPGVAPGVSARVPGAPAPVPGAAPQGGLSIMRQTPPVGAADAGRMAAGQTGNMVYNYAKAAGLTDIEAARALDMTKQTGGVHDLSTVRREGTQRIQSLFPTERYVENPRYGGLLTLDQGTGQGPRASYIVQGPVRDIPPGAVQGPAAPPPEGALRQLPQRVPVPNTPPPVSGLQQVTNIFNKMMRPVSSAASAIGRYVMPPLALASAAGEGTNIAQQMRKPENERDLTSAALSAGSILGSGLSMFPATAGLGIPIMLGTGAAQAYREKLAEQQAYRNSPEFQEFIRKKLEQPEREIYAP